MRSILTQIELFRGLSQDGLTLLARRGRCLTFEAGAQLLRQGQVNGVMYVILDGRVRVERWHPQLIAPLAIAELGPGDVVGEVGLLDDEPSATSVRATMETRALALSVSALAEALLEQTNQLAALLPAFSGRLRTARDLAAKAVQRGWIRPDGHPVDDEESVEGKGWRLAT